jgi:hypothetical protein
VIEESDLNRAKALLDKVGRAHGREVHSRYYEDNPFAVRAVVKAFAAIRAEAKAEQLAADVAAVRDFDGDGMAHETAADFLEQTGGTVEKVTAPTPPAEDWEEAQRRADAGVPMPVAPTPPASDPPRATQADADDRRDL